MPLREFAGPYVEHIGGGASQSGVVFLLVTQKVKKFELELFRHDPPYTRDPQHHSTLALAGPAGHGTVVCFPDGSIRVYASGGLVNADHVGGNYITIPNMVQPWKVEGTVSLLPLPQQQPVGIDTVARNNVATAMEIARQALATARAAEDDASKARKEIADLRDQLAALSVPTMKDLQDVAWEFAGRRIKHDADDDPASPLRQRIATQTQANLLMAIKYALEHPSKPNEPTPSKLRALIETTVKGS